jgi:hypothetical protein
MAKSHIRLNRGHPETIFRVRVQGLKPRTTYYYVVTSVASNDESDGVESPVKQFTMPVQASASWLTLQHLIRRRAPLTGGSPSLSVRELREAPPCHRSEPHSVLGRPDCICIA